MLVAPHNANITDSRNLVNSGTAVTMSSTHTDTRYGESLDPRIQPIKIVFIHGKWVHWNEIRLSNVDFELTQNHNTHTQRNTFHLPLFFDQNQILNTLYQTDVSFGIWKFNFILRSSVMNIPISFRISSFFWLNPKNPVCLFLAPVIHVCRPKMQCIVIDLST